MENGWGEGLWGGEGAVDHESGGGDDGDFDDEGYFSVGEGAVLCWRDTMMTQERGGMMCVEEC